MPRTDLERICARMQEVVDRNDVERFLIGTTVDLNRCRRALRAEDLVTLHEADTPEEAVEVEDALLARFESHPKCKNEGPHESDTDTLDGSGVLAIFVAVWWRR